MQDQSRETPNDPYDELGTPPGDPPASRPSRPTSEQHRDSTPFDEIHFQALQYLPRSMNSFLLVVLMAAGIGIGFAVLSVDPPDACGYWLNEVGTLHSSGELHCSTYGDLPSDLLRIHADCVRSSGATLVEDIWLLSRDMLVLRGDGYHYSRVLRYSLKQTDEIDFEASSAQFGFQCSNAKYLELNGSSLACNSDTFDDANSTATIFPSFVDVYDALNLPESIAQLSFTQYLFQLGERYVPNNAIQALSADYYISSKVIATVLEIVVTRSFRGGGVDRDRGDARCNPLLKLFEYLYAALFTILDWLQSLALLAILPITIGSILVDPSNALLAEFAGKWCLAVLLECAIQSLVLCSLLFFWVTRR